MATITTKYSVGDTVYFGSTTITRKQRPCPDCLGSRKWKATSPAGRDYEFGCPRCASSYVSDRDIALDYSAHVPCTTKLTIGQVRAQAGHEPENSYMCLETGIGSGSVYREQNLFPTEAEALAAADIKAKMADAETKWIVDLYNKSLRVCDYQLSDATILSEKSRLAAQRVVVEYTLSDLRGCISMDEVQRVIAKFDQTAEAA